MTLWYKYEKCDRRRYHEEVEKLYAVSSEFARMHRSCLGKKNSSTELDRMELVDAALDAGNEYVAMFIRNNLTTVKPKWVKKQEKAWRQASGPRRRRKRRKKS